MVQHDIRWFHLGVMVFAATPWLIVAKYFFNGAGDDMVTDKYVPVNRQLLRRMVQEEPGKRDEMVKASAFYIAELELPKPKDDAAAQR